MNMWMSRVFRYLDRFCVMQYNLLPLSDSGSVVFFQVVFKGIKEEVAQASLEVFTPGKAAPDNLQAKVAEISAVFGMA